MNRARVRILVVSVDREGHHIDIAVDPETLQADGSLAVDLTEDKDPTAAEMRVAEQAAREFVGKKTP